MSPDADARSSRSRRAPRPANAAGVAVLAAVAVLVAAYAWWAVGREPFTWRATLAVVPAGAAAAAWGTWRRGAMFGRTTAASPGAGARAPSVAWWALLAVVAAAWQLAAYLQDPRDDHPTLSSLTNAALDSQEARAAAFVAWLLATVGLARR
jgi:hypothetical protein